MRDRLDHAIREDGIVVVDQKPDRGLVGEGLANLLNDPGWRWVFRHVEMQELAAPVRNNKLRVEQLEANCGNDQEIHRGADISMVPKERHPSLTLSLVAFSLRQVTRYGRQAHGESQFLELRLDSPRRPGIFAGKPADQVPDRLGNPRPSGSALRDRTPDRTPVASESFAMPSDCGLGLGDDETGFPSGSETGKGNPRGPIERGEPRARVLLSVDGELLTEGKLDDCLLSWSTKQGGNRRDDDQRMIDEGSDCVVMLKDRGPAVQSDPRAHFQGA